MHTHAYSIQKEVSGAYGEYASVLFDVSILFYLYIFAHTILSHTVIFN